MVELFKMSPIDTSASQAEQVDSSDSKRSRVVDHFTRGSFVSGLVARFVEAITRIELTSSA